MGDAHSPIRSQLWDSYRTSTLPEHRVFGSLSPK